MFNDEREFLGNYMVIRVLQKKVEKNSQQMGVYVVGEITKNQ